jgi:hypothetical protein
MVEALVGIATAWVVLSTAVAGALFVAMWGGREWGEGWSVVSAGAPARTGSLTTAGAAFAD